MQVTDVYNYRPYLFSIAYNMLGEVEAAEDVVQDTFEKWLKADHSKVRNVKSYLSRIAVNTAVNRLEQLKKEREAYKGVWLPEPLLSEAPSTEEPTIDYAVMFMLEQLNPYERAVLVLRECFEIEYDEIAEFLGTSNDNCRQVYHRARSKISLQLRRKQKASEQHKKELLEAFLTACTTENLEQLRQVLKEDIVLYSDGGGKMPAALNPLPGLDVVTKALVGILRKLGRSSLHSRIVYVNDSPAALIYLDNRPDSVIMIHADEEGIANTFILRNPDKLRLDKISS